jgi:hypothetical protein
MWRQTWPNHYPNFAVICRQHEKNILLHVCKLFTCPFVTLPYNNFSSLHSTEQGTVRWTLKSGGSSAGDTEKSHDMSWEALPIEMEEKILFNLSLAELAAVSSTCMTFLEVFQKQLAAQQKTLCDSAVDWFGLERIRGFATLADRFINDKILNFNLAATIDIFGAQHFTADTLYINFHAWSGDPVQTQIVRSQEMQLMLYPTSPEDLGWVSVLLALLSGMVPSSFQDGTRAVRIVLLPHLQITPADVIAHLAPVLPLVAVCTSRCSPTGPRMMIKERMQGGEGGLGANKGIALLEIGVQFQQAASMDCCHLAFRAK